MDDSIKSRGNRPGIIMFEEAGNWNPGKLIDEKLLKELQDFQYGTAGDEQEIPYDMEPQDYRNRKAEKFLEVFKQSGIAFIDPPHRKLDPNPYIFGIDPYDASEKHMFSTMGMKIVNPGFNLSLTLKPDNA